MISLIIPIYNAEIFLDECIESIVKQSYSNFEIILVDDGSQDNSLELCRKWSIKDSRVKVIHKPNGGVSSARNAGLDIASGDYICFVDSDDTLPANALKSLRTAIEEFDTEIAIGAFIYQYGDKFVPHKMRLKKGKYYFSNILNLFIDDGTLSGFLLGNVWGTIYRKKIIQNNNLRFVDGLKNNEDGLFNFEYALDSISIYVTDSIVYHFRKDVVASKPNRNNEDFGSKIFDLLDAKEWPKDKYEYDKQKARRKVSLAWWKILNSTNEYSFVTSIKFIRDTISKSDVRKGLQYMCPVNMNRYKLIIFYLIKYRLCITLFCLIKYIIPILNKRIIR